MTPDQAVAIAQGLQLARAVLTTAQIGELLLRPEITTADVLAQFDATDAAIQKAREDN